MLPNETNNTPLTLERVSVRIPPFWAADLELWFVQIENQFSIAGITTDATEFSYLTGNLDAQYSNNIVVLLGIRGA